MIQAPPAVGGSEEEGVIQAPPAVVVESEGESCVEEGVGHTPPAVECVAEGLCPVCVDMYSTLTTADLTFSTTIHNGFVLKHIKQNLKKE